MRSFGAYEGAAAKRRALLLALREQREALTRAIYDELEPLSSSLVRALSHDDVQTVDRATLGPLLGRLIASLKRARALAQQDPAELR